MCPDCGGEKGLHQPHCLAMAEAWDALNPPPHFKLAEALEEKGYVVLAAIGFGTRPDGTYSCKVAAHPVLRSFTHEQFLVVVNALVKMYTTPLDDLDIQRL